jgi:hypothetical protein
VLDVNDAGFDVVVDVKRKKEKIYFIKIKEDGGDMFDLKLF